MIAARHVHNLAAGRLVNMEPRAPKFLGKHLGRFLEQKHRNTVDRIERPLEHRFPVNVLARHAVLNDLAVVYLYRILPWEPERERSPKFKLIRGTRDFGWSFAKPVSLINRNGLAIKLNRKPKFLRLSAWRHL